MENEKHFYKKLAELMPIIEGEFIQDLYFYFKTYKLDKERCEVVPKGYDGEGELIPRMEDIQDMREGLQKLFESRHQLFIKNDLYDFTFKH